MSPAGCHDLYAKYMTLNPLRVLSIINSVRYPKTHTHMYICTGSHHACSSFKMLWMYYQKKWSMIQHKLPIDTTHSIQIHSALFVPFRFRNIHTATCAICTQWQHTNPLQWTPRVYNYSELNPQIRRSQDCLAFIETFISSQFPIVPKTSWFPAAAPVILQTLMTVLKHALLCTYTR